MKFKISSLAYAILSFVIFILFSMTEVQASQADIQKIIGVNDLVAVNADATNIPFKFRNLVNAFGKIAAGCTATHIGDGYVLTAGHCFYAPPQLLKDRPCGEEYTVEWGVREGRSPYMISKCTRFIAAQRNNETDYALFQVYPAPSAAIKPDLTSKPLLGTKITIFSHPNELPLRWSKMCRIQRVFSSEKSLDFIHYVCDTDPGSSGATVINVETMRVIGIHDGGRLQNITDDNLGVGYNYGTYIYDTPLKEILLKLGF